MKEKLIQKESYKSPVFRTVSLSVQRCIAISGEGGYTESYTNEDANPWFS